MGAGKSLDLLRINDNYRNLNKKCMLMKPSIDTRWKTDKIISRIGIEENCISFSKKENLYNLILEEFGSDNPYSCILIDEAQFLTKKQVWGLCDVVDWNNVPVVCFGLRTDYNGITFEGSNALLGVADEIKEIITLCHCGRKATMVLRFDPKTGKVMKDIESELNRDGSVYIGDAVYISVCRKHWSNGDLGKNG
jgi:thymidine kinase